MKLGTQTGSMTNHILSRSVKGQPTPETGMGATILKWTDREAGTIVSTWKTKAGVRFVQVQEDKATRTDKNGMSDAGQTYTYERDINGRIYIFRMKANGMWQEVGPGPNGRYINRDGSGLQIGVRNKYHDYSF